MAKNPSTRVGTTKTRRGEVHVTHRIQEDSPLHKRVLETKEFHFVLHHIAAASRAGMLMCHSEVIMFLETQLA